MERILDYTAKFDGTVEENLKAYGFSSVICGTLKKEYGLTEVNGMPVFLVHRIKAGDIIRVKIKETPRHIRPYKANITIVYQDDDLAIVDKPPGLAAISTAAHYEKSLMNALAYEWGDFVYHPLTRLDKGTSGLTAVAKHALSHSLLNGSLADGKAVKREYIALVGGRLTGGGVIDAPIAKEGDAYKRVVKSGGKPALTRYQPIEIIGEYTLVRFRLFTGRTHQIRVHSAHIGHPLVGDEMYGGEMHAGRPMLHSASLELVQPITGEELKFESDIPPDMAEVIDKLRKAQLLT